MKLHIKIDGIFRQDKMFYNGIKEGGLVSLKRLW